MDNELEEQLTALETGDKPTLRAQWRELYGREAPRRASKTLMRLAVAYRLQERVYGGLSAAARRELKEIALQCDTGPRAKGEAGPQLRLGMRLVREFKSELHEVTVLEEGFAYRGQSYKSLSKIARLITGTQWSGPAFFGLRKPKSKTADHEVAL